MKLKVHFQIRVHFILLIRPHGIRIECGDRVYYLRWKDSGKWALSWESWQ